jgi:hypothetical protein
VLAANSLLVLHAGGGNDVIQARDGAADSVSCGTGDDRAVVDPGAADVPGNGVDEDCSGADAAVPPVPHHVAYRWDLAATWSRVVQLKITQLPARAKLTVTCKGRGCPFKSRATTTGDLTKLFKRRKLSKGTVVDVRIDAPGYKSVVVRFTVKGNKKLPAQRELPA